MHVIEHRHPGPDLELSLAGLGGGPIPVQRIAARLEKHRRPKIAPPRHMMRQAGNNNAGDAGHARECGGGS